MAATEPCADRMAGEPTAIKAVMMKIIPAFGRFFADLRRASYFGAGDDSVSSCLCRRQASVFGFRPLKSEVPRRQA